MFWFDKENENTVFMDRRVESHKLNDKTKKGGVRDLVISPDVQADFTALPYPSNYFYLVVFDPPHFEKNGEKSWLNLKYGTLKGDWKTMLRGGFSECFRVLRPFGTLVFKWCETEIPLSEILKLTDVNPIVGHKSGKASNTHWVTFLKS